MQIREYLPARFQQPDGRDLVVSETSSTSTDASGTDWVRGAGGIALLLARAPSCSLSRCSRQSLVSLTTLTDLDLDLSIALLLLTAFMIAVF